NASLGSAVASDNSGDAVTITRSGVPVGNAFPLGTTVVTYTATDPAGNTASATQRVTVGDDTAPALTIPANAAYQLRSQVPVAAAASATASDNCGAVSLTVSDADNGGLGSP